MKTSKLGIRGLFRIAVVSAVALASVVLTSISYVNVSADQRTRAEAAMRSEINYLHLQLESLGNRVDTFDRIANTTDIDLQQLDPEGYRILVDSVGDVLSGYTLEQTGTVAIIADDTIIASDDARIPVGSDVRTLLGDEVHDAIDASLQGDQTLAIPYVGVFDEDGGIGSYGENDDEAFLLATQQGNYTVMIIEPSSMVHKDRKAIISREFMTSFVVLVAVAVIVDCLLTFIIARRIEEMDELLERITLGDLDVRIKEGGTREFASLAFDINITLDALQGLIAEAETRMDSELAAARAIQESALPRTFPPYPEIEKFDVYAIMDAAEEVGGDFYDFFLIGDSGPGSGKLVFLVADVSDKGIPAALFMMRAKTLIRRELLSGAKLNRAVENASKQLADGNTSCMFVTMWVGVLDYEKGRVKYVNAGHNPPLIWQKGSGWSWIKDRQGLPLGLPINQSYKTRSLDCSAGDKFLIYTDGVTEALSKDGELYGEARIEAVANAHENDHPEALVNALQRDVASFTHGAEQSDDLTVLALELKSR